MPAAAKTPNYELNQWAGNEYPKRQDFVDDNSIVDTALAGINTALNNHKVDYTLQVPYGGTTTNSGNAYAIAAPAISALTAGMALAVKINVDSTGAATLNWNNIGAKAVKKANGMAVSNLKGGGIYTLRYDGTNFILQGEGASGNATASDLRSGKTATVDAGEISGTLALTGDALAANVLAGKFFYSNDLDTKIEGTMVNKGGNTAATAMYALENLVVDGNFADIENAWILTQANGSASYKFPFTSVQLHSSNGSSVAAVEQPYYVIQNHIYYASIWALKSGTLSNSGEFDVYSATTELGNGPLTDATIPNSGTWTHLSWRASTTLASNWCKIRAYTFTTNYLYVDGYMLLDLTAIFGAGNEPSQATMDALIETTFGGFFDGTEIITKLPAGAYLTNGFTGAPDTYYANSTLKGSNVKSGVDILGVTGTLSGIKSVQYGSVSITGGNTAGTATITSVNIANSVVVWLGQSVSVATNGTVRFTLTNATTITADRVYYSSSTTVAKFMVIEFESGIIKTKQSGTISLGNTATSATATVTGVNTNKALLFWAGDAASAGTSQTYDMVNVTLTNATTITVARYAYKDGYECSHTIAWQLLEFY